jgi:hypothetical protein
MTTTPVPNERAGEPTLTREQCIEFCEKAEEADYGDVMLSYFRATATHLRAPTPAALTEEERGALLAGAAALMYQAGARPNSMVELEEEAKRLTEIAKKLRAAVVANT